MLFTDSPKPRMSARQPAVLRVAEFPNLGPLHLSPGIWDVERHAMDFANVERSSHRSARPHPPSRNLRVRAYMMSAFAAVGSCCTTASLDDVIFACIFWDKLHLFASAARNRLVFIEGSTLRGQTHSQRMPPPWKTRERNGTRTL